MAHRNTFSRPRRGGISEAQRRKKSWFGIGFTGFDCMGIDLIPAAPAVGSPTISMASVSSASAAANGFLEGTILRIRGSISVPKSTPQGTASGAITVAVGFGFVTDDAALAQAVPNPATAVGADWDGWMFFRSNVAAPLDANAAILDQKSMRKWSSGTSLVFVAGACTDSATPGTETTVLITARILLLLP